MPRPGDPTASVDARVRARGSPAGRRRRIARALARRRARTPAPRPGRRRVAARHDVVPAQELAVRDDHARRVRRRARPGRRPPRATGRRRCRRPQPSGGDAEHDHVHGGRRSSWSSRSSAGASTGAPSRRPARRREPTRRARSRRGSATNRIGAPRLAAGRRPASVGVVAVDLRRRAAPRRRSLPHGSPFADHVRATPRGRHDTAVARRRRHRGAARRGRRGSGATSPTWRSRSMHCLTLRTKSPPVSSSSSSTSARSSPRAHSYA